MIKARVSFRGAIATENAQSAGTPETHLNPLDTYVSRLQIAVWTVSCTQNLRQPLTGSVLVRTPIINGPEHEASAAATLIHTCATEFRLEVCLATRIVSLLTRSPSPGQDLAGYTVPQGRCREAKGYQYLRADEPVYRLRARCNSSTDEGKRDQAEHKRLADLEDI